MRKLPVVIGAATACAALYQVAPFAGVPDRIVIVLYLLSPLVVSSMAYVILKYGTPSPWTFEEKFYADSSDLRIPAEERPSASPDRRPGRPLH